MYGCKVVIFFFSFESLAEQFHLGASTSSVMEEGEVVPLPTFSTLGIILYTCIISPPSKVFPSTDLATVYNFELFCMGFMQVFWLDFFYM